MRTFAGQSSLARCASTCGESPSEPNVVYLYEAYVDQDAFGAHKANEPFKKFVEEVVPSLFEPPTFVLPFTSSYTSNASG